MKVEGVMPVSLVYQRPEELEEAQTEQEEAEHRYAKECES
jgi:nitrate reductase NapAB chaperone NapD